MRFFHIQGFSLSASSAIVSQVCFFVRMQFCAVSSLLLTVTKAHFQQPALFSFQFRPFNLQSMANSFSCIFPSLILNEILNETAFPLKPHFYILTFSKVWSWDLPSSRSTVVLLNHHSLSLVCNPSSIKVYVTQWGYSLYSHLPFHKLLVPLPFSPDTGIRLSLYLSWHHSAISLQMTDPTWRHSQFLYLPEQIVLISPLPNILLVLPAVASLLKVHIPPPCWTQFEILVLVAQSHFYPSLSEAAQLFLDCQCILNFP